MSRRCHLLAAGLLVGALLTACGGREAPKEDPPARVEARGQLEVWSYVVPWDGSRGLASWTAGADGVLTGISPVWLTPTPEGRVVRQDPGRTAEVVSRARGTGAAVVPSVSNFVDGRWDGELVAAVVGDRTRRARHVEAITRAVTENGWDGVDIDYESLPSEARDSFSRFVSELGKALRANGAILTVTVQAKTADAEAGLEGSQDWAAIGRGADRVRVMAYDHAWSTSKPGSVAPLPWVGEVLAFAVSEVPADKVELGIGAYGYDWSGSEGTPLSWQEAVAMAEKHGADVRWDSATASSSFTYTDAHDVKHVVWFENARSAGLKSAAARRHGVAGVVLWQLGGADPRLWSVLAGGG